MGSLAGMRIWGRISKLALALLCCLYLVQPAPAACPSPDLTGDCFVDFEDFAILAAQWPTSDFNNIAAMASHWLVPDPRIPPDMTYIPGGTFEMGDSFAEGNADERPVHTVIVDSFYMGKYEATNGQYCDYLKSAKSQGLITVTSGRVYKAGSGTSYPYCDTSTSSSYSQIAYSGGVFSVGTPSAGRDMSNDPVVEVTWYGAAAYCNWRSEEAGYEQSYDLSTWNCDFSKKGYRLPSEAEWEYAGRGGLGGRRFPWGDTISHTQANYFSSDTFEYDVGPTRGYHPLWTDGIPPYTSPVGFFDGTMRHRASYDWPGSGTSYQTTSGVNNYGLYDMADNVSEWCNDWYSSSYYSTSPTSNPTGPISGTFRVRRGGAWKSGPFSCRVAYRAGASADYRHYAIGFRVVLSD